jgi:hypothetical protein
MKRPFETYLHIVLLGFLSANGLAGGGLLALAPDGHLIQMQPDWLEGTPFPNFLIPGLLLFTFVGLLSGFTCLGLAFRSNWKLGKALNIYEDRHWAWTWSLYCAISLMIWIVAQQFLTRYFILQPILMALGILILIVTLLPRVMKSYAQSNR